MKYAVDRIEDDIIVLENLDNNKIENISKDVLPNVKEGDIVILENGIYRVDTEEGKKRRKTIKTKMDRLRSDEWWSQ